MISFETRLGSDAAGLIEKHGGRVIQAPTIKEVPLSELAEAKAFFEALFGGAVDALILLTGIGTTLLIRAALLHRSRAEVVAQLAKITLVCRGPKPSAALKSFGLRATLSVPEPNTWRELLATLDAECSVRGLRVCIQEYGTRNEELVRALILRGAQVTSIKLYSTTLPDDTGPLKAAILKIVRGQAHVALFTSGVQVDHLLSVAQEIGLAPAVRRALNTELVVASVGPMTSAALERQGITPDIVPGHPKLGHLVLAVARRAPVLLGGKRDERERGQPLLVAPAPVGQR